MSLPSIPFPQSRAFFSFSVSFFFLLAFLPELKAQSKILLGDTNIVNLALRGEAKLLVDEQALAGDPRGGSGGAPLNAFDQIYNSLYNPATILVRLFEDYALEELWLYDSNGKDTITIFGGDPSQWVFLGQVVTDRYNQWRSFAINDTFKFIRLDFHSPQATINELVLYGKALGSNKTSLPIGQKTAPVSMDKLMGINGLVDDPLPMINHSAGTLREFHRWDWDEGNKDPGYNGFVAKEFAFAPSYVSVWDFDDFYSQLVQQGVEIMPCLQGAPQYIQDSANCDCESKPILPNSDAEDPFSYAKHAEYMFQFAARYGQSVLAPSLLKLRGNQEPKSGLALVNYLEGWNEPDKWWRERNGFFTPFELAAMSSADCDGHEGAMGSGFGMKAADPNMKMVMPGLATLDLNYLEGIRLWSIYNRQSGLPFDVLNFHHYSNNAGGQFGNATQGISPEADGLKEKLAKIVRYRDTWLPGKEIWLSEFGYDTNPNSPQGVPALGQNDQAMVQAQWLMRSFLEIAAAGIDRGQVFMLRDVNAPNPNKYNSSGLTQEKWNQHQAKKSYFYISGMRRILKDYFFEGELKLANDELRAYRFRHRDTDSLCYAIWSATSEAKLIPNYRFPVEGFGRALVAEAQSDTIAPSLSQVAISRDSVSIQISETPLFLKLLPEDLVLPTAQAQNVSAYLDSNGFAILEAREIDAGSTDDKRLIKRYLSRDSLSCTDLPDNQNTADVSLWFYACDHYQCDSVQFVVDLRDTLAPSLSTKKVQAYFDATGQVVVQGRDFVQSAVDNCSGDIEFRLNQSQFQCSDHQGGSLLRISSDASWKKSTYTSLVNATSWPWQGAGDFPAAHTYTDSAELGQPYPWHSIDPVPGTEVIKAGSRVQYFKKNFELSGEVLKATFAMTIDDDAEIYLNGLLLARENVWGAPTQGAAAIHAFQIDDQGNYINGLNGASSFNLINGQALKDFFQEGHNEILVVLRNGGPGNLGGFSFKMEAELNQSLLLVSDRSWQKSSLISTQSALSFPWSGAQVFPSDTSFSQKAILGQPNPWKSIDPVPGAEVVKCGSGVEFYRKKFNLKGNYWSDLRLWMRVDDDMEIYLNGRLIARENTWGQPTMGPGSLHSLSWGENQWSNGSDSSSAFNFADSAALDYLKSGENELVIAVRNTLNGNTGGFSFRCEVKTEPSTALDLTATDRHGNHSNYKVFLKLADSLGICEANATAKRSLGSKSAIGKRPDDLKVFPNPTRNSVSIQLPAEARDWVEVDLINSAGHSLRTLREQCQGGQILSLDLESLAPALYILRVSGNFGLHTEVISKLP